MPFFFPQQQASLAQEQEEMDLFQLLSLLSAASSEEEKPKPQPQPQPQPQKQQHFFSHCGPRRQHRQTPTFIPAFDILETGNAYELFGEVPGLDIKSLEVRFEDAQTLVLRGLTQRARPTAAPAAAVAEQQPDVVNEKAAEVEVEVKEDIKGKQASVEDESEYDSVDTPLSSSATVTATAPTTTTETPAPAAIKPEQAKPQQTIRAKYWLAERKTGQFARSFSFAQRIEIDDVSAELKEGVLHVIVPKSVKSKKVEVVVV